jgi:hypothetical protein
VNFSGDPNGEILSPSRCVQRNGLPFCRRAENTHYIVQIHVQTNLNGAVDYFFGILFLRPKHVWGKERVTFKSIWCLTNISVMRGNCVFVVGAE